VAGEVLYEGGVAVDAAVVAAYVSELAFRVSNSSPILKKRPFWFLTNPLIFGIIYTN
jgi:hypothetical protein